MSASMSLDPMLSVPSVRGPGRPKLDDDTARMAEVTTCIRLRRHGVSIPVLMRLFDISQTTVYRWLKMAADPDELTAPTDTDEVCPN